jgi:putative component of toxin-antitoxin plasmid stabilization module
MNAQGQLVDSGVELIAPEGDWIIEMQAVSGSGYRLYAAASDLVGRLRISPTSVDLVTAN